MTFWQLLKAELRAIFTDKAILTTVFGGVLLYSFLYPLPYSNQTPREQAIVVVNLDGSQMSRKLERMVDATPEVAIHQRAFSIEEARDKVINGEVSGLLVIPEHFHRDLLQGRSPTLVYAGDASYFLVYGTIVKGLAQAGGTLAAQVKISREVISGTPMEQAASQFTAIRLNTNPVFNPTIGYVDYVVPAIFIMVLHQTLIMGIGMMGGAQNELSRAGCSGYWQRASVLKVSLVRLLAFCLLYIPLMLYYLGFSFEHLDIIRQANISQLCLLAVPFLISSSAFGLFIGAIIPRKELAVLIGVASSFPIVFSIGFIWPASEIPSLINWLMQWIPGTQAVTAFVKLNQMGADFVQILPVWYSLWGLALLYLFLTLLITRYKKAG